MAVYQTLTLKETQVDTLANTSSVHILWKSQQTGESHNDYTRTAKYRITANGVTTEHTLSYTLPGKTTKTILSETVVIPHGEDGTGSVTVQTWMDTSISAGVVELSRTLTLTPIARAGTVGATDAFVESTSIIAVSRKSQDYTHSIQFIFGDLTGYINGDGSITELEVKHTASNIPFLIPPLFYRFMPDRKSQACELVCRTYHNDGQVGSDQHGSFTVTAKEELCKPAVRGSVQDVNSETLKLTGDPNRLIRYMSTAQCRVTAEGKNHAGITGFSINGEAAGDMLEVPKVENGVFLFKAEDSRGYSDSVTVEKTLILYTPVTVNARIARTDPTSGKAKLEVWGKCFAGSFGAATNEIAVCCSVGGTEPAVLHAEVNQREQTYTVSAVLSGLDYSRAHSVTVSVADALSSAVQTLQVKEGVPAFDWGKKDFAFHVPVSVDGDLNMHDFGVKNLRTPVAKTDAATKAYADRKLSLVKLWENPLSSDVFSPRTVALDLRQYTGVSVCFRGAASAEDLHMSEFIPMDTGVFMHGHGLSGEIRQRNVQVSAGGVRFEAGRGAEGENNAYAVPVAVYGWSGTVEVMADKTAICGTFLCGEVICGQ